MQIMEEDLYQKELFEFKKPKRPFSRFDNIFPKSDFALILNLEKLIFVAIGVIMLMVVIYALGVERGRALSNRVSLVTVKALPVVQRTVVRTPQKIVAPVTPDTKNITAAPQKSVQTEPAAKVNAVNTPVASIVKSASAMPYTIAVATFSRKEWALKETDKIKNLGYEAFVTQSGPYYMVCLGSYPNKDSAKAVLTKIRSTYKDAYLKIR